MQQHRLPVEAAPASAGAWYRQPVLWLGAAILAASLAGCVWMIVLGVRHADQPLEMTGRPHTLLDMPMHGAGNGKQETAGGEGAKPLPPHDAAGAPGRVP
ncbi:hypothetical protein [Frateuria soli]|uniref:hypothetical protein n=1 Tax=Frateuria soli TaxID=1542730 RepID=UPI001E451AAD|nr:hypothetical protein [Frateuria soli]UGB37599.1 hypothetical protein LQ771_12290 [Frateuria soli]